MPGVDYFELQSIKLLLIARVMDEITSIEQYKKGMFA